MLQSLLGFAEIAGVVNRVAVGVRGVGVQAHINAHDSTRWEMFNHPIRLYTKLDVVTVSPTQEPDALDLLDREGFNRTCPDQT
ncbi:hypothetical protein KDK_49800 [Dictyobacter kobayashii]|uniref:Uncharacterized protein n=1 Tax=Dictyobacter kobayashii TaxID=2014872 RepID=A0A402AQA3_9CHLR|nr:hypothetical protein KDK_49800 [Dictyobacter kobayashii]